MLNELATRLWPPANYGITMGQPFWLEIQVGPPASINCRHNGRWNVLHDNVVNWGSPMPIVSVDEAFKELLRRIELNPSRVALASQRYSAIKAAIESALPGKTLHQIGSFQRKTKIRPADMSDKLDIDVLVSFGYFFQYARNPAEGISPGKTLEIVRQGLRWNETYRIMPQEQDHPIVRLAYADQMAIELAPAFADLTGQHSHGPDGPTCYIVAASPYTWVTADYDYDARLITALNSSSRMPHL
jgi:Second Messenger Oligonucleotide or Dinucleotide Synthetase domain